ncbi:hypothetical protein D3C80_1382110 [compost metagenome]
MGGNIFFIITDTRRGIHNFGKTPGVCIAAARAHCAGNIIPAAIKIVGCAPGGSCPARCPCNLCLTSRTSGADFKVGIGNGLCLHGQTVKDQYGCKEQAVAIAFLIHIIAFYTLNIDQGIINVQSDSKT